MVGNTLQDVAQTALWVDAVQLVRARQRVHHRCCLAADVGPRVQIVLPANRNAAQGALSRVVVGVDTPSPTKFVSAVQLLSE